MSALCRAACLRLLPRLTRAAAPLRQMSASSVPGSSGQGTIYYLFVAVAAAGGGFYVYRTLSRDKMRFQDRASYLESRAKEWTPPSSGDGEDAEISEAVEVSEEVEEPLTAEAVAVDGNAGVKQNANSKESNQPEEGSSPVEGVTPSATDEVVVQQEATTSLEEDHVEEMTGEALEAKIISVPEERSHSSEEVPPPSEEDLSELSFRKPEAVSE